ncbi:MAG: riboflavin synthase [Lysobacterales bacterium]|nr:MAG: riboflavin synthase [Xanthomonadales bacterium]
MFTGIVTAKGSLRQKIPLGGDCRLWIDCGPLALAGARSGDSVCVSGVCLTMLEPRMDAGVKTEVNAGGGHFQADVSQETLGLTTLGGLQEGQAVNLELALQAQDRLGGHLVSGHVDGMATLVSRRPDARAERLEFEVPAALARYLARKGSVCLDGVSLTVNDVDGCRFGVCLIPHTLAVTTLGELRPGERVNLEVDLVARYLERLAAPFLESASAAAGRPPEPCDAD